MQIFKPYSSEVEQFLDMCNVSLFSILLVSLILQLVYYYVHMYLQRYKLATGGVHPAVLRQAREIHGDDEGKMYGSLVSQEAGACLEGEKREQGERSKRKRKRKGTYNGAAK